VAIRGRPEKRERGDGPREGREIEAVDGGYSPACPACQPRDEDEFQFLPNRPRNDRRADGANPFDTVPRDRSTTAQMDGRRGLGTAQRALDIRGTNLPTAVLVRQSERWREAHAARIRAQSDRPA